jgi:hypothetical protein
MYYRVLTGTNCVIKIFFSENEFQGAGIGEASGNVRFSEGHPSNTDLSVMRKQHAVAQEIDDK